MGRRGAHDRARDPSRSLLAPSPGSSSAAPPSGRRRSARSGSSSRPPWQCFSASTPRRGGRAPLDGVRHAPARGAEPDLPRTARLRGHGGPVAVAPPRPLRPLRVRRGRRGGAGDADLSPDRPTFLEYSPYFEAPGFSILALAEPGARAARRGRWRRSCSSPSSSGSCPSRRRSRSARSRAPAVPRRRSRPSLSPSGSSPGTSPGRCTPRSERTTSAPGGGELPGAADWVDRAAARPARHAGQQLTQRARRPTARVLEPLDREGVERRRHRTWPGRMVTPDLGASTGRSPPTRRSDYVVARPGIEVSARKWPRVGAGRPVPLAPRCGCGRTTGVAADGWAGGETGDPSVTTRAAYNRFDVSAEGWHRGGEAFARSFCATGVRRRATSRVASGSSAGDVQAAGARV